MKTKNNLVRKFSLSSGLALALVFAVWLSGAALAEDHGGKMDGMASGGMKDMDKKAAQPPVNMNHIKTQAEAEALKPGDSISMVCKKCKSVMAQQVTTDQAHIKMMTIGEKHMCHDCGGTVKVVGTGKGKGKHKEVKHVCTKCGDDAMFVCATKPGSGAMKGMKME